MIDNARQKKGIFRRPKALKIVLKTTVCLFQTTLTQNICERTQGFLIQCVASGNARQPELKQS